MANGRRHGNRVSDHRLPRNAPPERFVARSGDRSTITQFEPEHFEVRAIDLDPSAGGIRCFARPFGSSGRAAARMPQHRRRIHGRDRPTAGPEQSSCPAGAIHTWSERQWRMSSAQPVCHCWASQRLFRRARSAGRPAKCGMATRGSRLRRRLVQRSVARQRDTPLHPLPKAARDACEIRQATLQMAQSHRDHGWQAERLAACGNPIRQMPEGLLVRYRPRGARYLLAMSPDPKGHEPRAAGVVSALTD